MRVTEIHIYQQDLPVVGGSYRMSHSSVASMDTTIVEVITDEGMIGYGETCPVGSVYAPQHAAGARAALAEIAPRLLGRDPMLTEVCGHVMDDALNGHRYAKAALNIAMWDILGKHCGLRVCDLLGGALRERVPSYAVIDVTTPEDAAAAADEHQSAGFGRVQLKIGGRSVEEDIASVRQVCGVLLPGVRLAVDANRSLTIADAVALTESCRDLQFVLEQPCNTLDELTALRARAHHPIFVDELAEDLTGVLRAISMGVADGFGLKLTRLGGLSAMRTARDVCRATRRPHTCDDTWGGDIIAAACVHIGSTVRPELLEGVWIAAPYIEHHYDPHHGIRLVNGCIDVPKRPGLGISPDAACWGTPIQSYTR